MAKTAATAHQKFASNAGTSGIIVRVCYHECKRLNHSRLPK